MNSVTLYGRIGKDVELRNLESGKSVATFSLATSERYKDKDGNKKEITTWHNIVAWNPLSGIIAKYVKKGDPLLLHGKISNRSYEKDGTTRYTSEVIVDNIELVGGSKDKPNQERQGGSDTNGESFTPSETTGMDDLPF